MHYLSRLINFHHRIHHQRGSEYKERIKLKNNSEEVGVVSVAGGGEDVVGDDVAERPQARTSTRLNPTGSLDLSSPAYSLARASPASKCVLPFCSGTCFATFSRWKLKKTKRPRKRDTPVLRLITSDGLSSARTATDRRAGVARNDTEERVLGDGARRRPDTDGEDRTAAVEVAMALSIWWWFLISLAWRAGTWWSLCWLMEFEYIAGC